MIGSLALSRQKNTPMILDTIRNGIVYEMLGRSDDKLEQLPLAVLASLGLIAFC